MLQSLLATLTVKPLDVQIWDCNPLLILKADENVAYAQPTKIEFTPFDETSPTIGHAIALVPGKDGVCPEISITTRQYIDNQIEMAKRQGIVLLGTDQNGETIEWFINGAADRFMTTPDPEQLPYDEETAKILEQELVGQPDKLNLNSFI